MPYTPERSWATGDLVSASDLNTYLRDNVDYVKALTDGLTFSGAKVDRAGAGSQSIPNATDTDVTLTNEVFDNGGWWSSGASFTVPASAIPSGFTTIAVQVVCLIRFVSNGTGTRKLLVLKNGVEQDSFGLSALTGETTSVSLVSFFTVVAADTIKLQAYQSSTAALNMDVARLTVVRTAPVS